MKPAWFCPECCAGEPPPYYPYYPYGPYSGLYSQGPPDPCSCCGGNNIVVTFTDAVDVPDGSRAVIFGSCPTCETPTRQLWTDIIGQSMTLAKIADHGCVNGGVYKEWYGCASFPMRYRSTRTVDGGADCPDVNGTIYIKAAVTCDRDGASGVRCVSLKLIGNVGRWNNNASCANFGDCTGSTFGGPLSATPCVGGSGWMTNGAIGRGTDSICAGSIPVTSGGTGAPSGGIKGATITF